MRRRLRPISSLPGGGGCYTQMISISPSSVYALNDDGYEAAHVSRTRRRYQGSGGTADDHLDKSTLFQLRELCRKHDRDGSLMSGILNSACDEIVGPEFSYQPSSGDSAWDQLAAAYIAARMEAAACDVRGAMDKTTQLKTTLRAVWTDGDQLQVDVAGGATQFFEADELVQPRSVGNSGKTIVNGVELDGDLRAVAYHVLKRGVSNPLGFVASLDQTQAIPASQARLVAYRKRVTQTRGVPFLASILGIYQRLDGYLDSETLAAEMGAKVAYQIIRDAEDSSALPGSESYADGNETSDSVSVFSQLLRLEAGMVFDNRPGEEIKPFVSQRPFSNFDPYIITVCRIVGAGIGFPLELLLKDFSKTNYSSARASLSIVRRSFQAWQKFLERHDCLPWYRRQIALGIASGELPLPAADGDPYSVRCVWPAWPWVDPLKERQADEIALRNRTTSRRRIILAGGEVPEEIWAELQEEDKLFTPKQLQPFVPGGQGGGQDEGQDGQDDGQPDPPPEDDDRDDEPEDTDEDQP